MKVVIAGGRTFRPIPEDYELLDLYHEKYTITEVVSGTCRGADMFGEHWGESRGVPIKRFPADWERLGKKAGFLRNEEMAKYADAVILFPGGKGTANMKDLAVKYKLEILYDEN